MNQSRYKHSTPLFLMITASFIGLNVLFKVIFENVAFDWHILFNPAIFAVMGPFATVDYRITQWLSMLLINTAIYPTLIYFGCVAKNENNQYIFFAFILWIVEGLWCYAITYGTAIT